MPAARTLRVLVVDDQASIRALMRGYLRKLGFESVDDATNGADGFMQLQVRPYNLVISDFHMENGSGLELLKNMRAHPILKRTPVIMVTGSADREIVTAVIQAGVNGYIVKPVSFEALKQRVVQLVGPLT